MSALGDKLRIEAFHLQTLAAEADGVVYAPPVEVPYVPPSTSGGVPDNGIEIPYRSDVARTKAPGGPACLWFRTPTTASARGSTNISIVANHPAASKLVLSLTENGPPITTGLAKAESYGDSGETRSIPFFVGKEVPYVVSLPLDTIIYAKFWYTGDLDGGPIQAYLSNAQ